MRTENNRLFTIALPKTLLVAIGILGLAAFLVHPGARAADITPVPPPAAPTTAIVPPASAAPAVIAADHNNKTEDVGKLVSDQSDKAMDGGQSAVKQLENSNGTVNMGDLNNARQAIARIDMMIDLERRLAELDKLRNGHGAGSASALASAIPASALQPMPRPVVETSVPPALPENRPTPITHVAPTETSDMNSELIRVSGTEGNYTALVKTLGGDAKPVHVGDALAGGTVKWIMPSAIGVETGGKTRTLHVKNVGIVYDASR